MLNSTTKIEFKSPKLKEIFILSPDFATNCLLQSRKYSFLVDIIAIVTSVWLSTLGTPPVPS